MAEGAEAAAAAPAMEVEAAAPAVAAPAPVVEEVLTEEEAVKRVIRASMVVDGLRRGLHECAKALAKAGKAADGSRPVGGARLCLLAADCDEPAYVKLVKALCAEKEVPIREIPEASQLGQMVGLCKLDKEGNPRKVVSTSVAVITDFGAHSKALKVLGMDA